MTLFVTWFLFPLVLAALAIGCGLLVERIAGINLPGVLLPATGVALIIVVAQFFTLDGGLAELITPVTVALAVVGFGLSLPVIDRGVAWWAVIAAVAVFAVYAAPIVLSGEATFAGYIKLDDTATWMTLTDRVMEHGRSLRGLPPSTYEATLAFNLGAGYPVGVFLPLGVATGARRTGRRLGDPALHGVHGGAAGARCVVDHRATRKVAAPPRAGGLPRRPVGSALRLLPLGRDQGDGRRRVRDLDRGDGGVRHPRAGVATTARAAGGDERGADRGPERRRRSLAGAAPSGRAGRVHPAPRLGRGSVRAAVFAAATVVMCLPVIIPGGLLPPTSSPLTSETALGNLYHPLTAFQLFGIWPTGDFRADPHQLTTTYILIGVVAIAALIGIALAVRAKSWALVLYLGAAIFAALAIFVIGSPWVGGKALATASPAIPIVAAAGGVALFAGGRHVEGAVLIAVLAVGVLWSNALAYRDVNLAPRPQLAELETIAGIVGDQGPTLMTEYQPYGVRHFLREAAPEGASELRRRVVPLVGSGPCPANATRSTPGGPCSLRKGYTADIDQFQLEGILTYRTLVLRRGPGGSRPPSPYRLVYEGKYYDAWQRPVGSTQLVVDHLGLGTVTDPAAVPRCAQVHRLARRAGPNGTLATVSRDPVVVVPLSQTQHPAAWDSPSYTSALLPQTPGTLTARVQVPQSGDYTIYLGGSVRPQVDLSVDGKQVSSSRQFLNNYGEYVGLGSTNLTAGSHTISITFHGSDLHPGSGGTVDPIGPLALTDQDAANTKVSYFPTSQASQLCGQRWDWIEAVQGASGQ